MRTIALTLTGKLPPYRTNFNVLIFAARLKEVFQFSDEQIDFYHKNTNRNDEEFYFMVLDYLQ